MGGRTWHTPFTERTLFSFQLEAIQVLPLVTIPGQNVSFVSWRAMSGVSDRAAQSLVLPQVFK